MLRKIAKRVSYRKVEKRISVSPTLGVYQLQFCKCYQDILKSGSVRRCYLFKKKIPI